jgi:hypothetical protein
VPFSSFHTEEASSCHLVAAPHCSTHNVSKCDFFSCSFLLCFTCAVFLVLFCCLFEQIDDQRIKKNRFGKKSSLLIFLGLVFSSFKLLKFSVTSCFLSAWILVAFLFRHYYFRHSKSDVLNWINLSTTRKLRANPLTNPHFGHFCHIVCQSYTHFRVAILCANPVRLHSGSTLLEIKKSFRNVGNVLYDWAGDDYCSWRGVLCDNVTFAVVAL